MKTELDQVNQNLVAQRIQAREQIVGPRLGDYLLFPTGELERLGTKMGKGYQTTPSGSFFLWSDGDAQCSGSYHPIVDAATLELTSVRLRGAFWFFDHDEVGPDRGVTFKIPCQVFTTSADYKGYLGKEFESSDIEALKKELADLIAGVITNP